MKQPVILVFIDWFLPGYKAGGPIRSCANLIAHLSNQFRFKIITRNTDYCQSQPYKEISGNRWIYFDENVEIYYLTNRKVTIKNIRDIINKTHFDILYLNGIFSFYFSILPLLILRKSKKRKIVAARGMLSDHAIKVKPLKKKVFITIMKLIKLYQGVTFQATAEKEQQEIAKQIPGATIKIAPNLPRKIISGRPRRRKKQSNSIKLVYVGRISPEKNLLYALECLNSCTVDIIYDIYGQIYDDKYWDKCADIIKKLPINIIATYKDCAQSDEVPALLSKYHFLFLPTTGENYGHVIIESLLSGCPVIISNNTPWQNLKTDNAGWNLSLNDKATFVKTINDAANMQQEEYDKMSYDAYNTGLKHLNTSDGIDKNIKLFNNEA